MSPRSDPKVRHHALGRSDWRRTRARAVHGTLKRFEGDNPRLSLGMELRHLRYFVTVAAELHFARAAQRLFISQPALSQQIRSLESELGFRLLERNSRGVELTAEGAAFLIEAKIVVRDADHAGEVARALAEGATGHLRLGHLRTMPRGLPERVVSEYQRRYP